MAAGPAAAALLGRPLLLVAICCLAVLHPNPACAASSAAGASTLQQRHLQQPHYYQPHLIHHGDSVAPVLANYSFGAALDTFEICRQQAGMAEGQEVPQEELLQLFRLPKDLNKHKHLSLPQLVQLLHAVQPEFRVVFEPMLSGETDISRLIDPVPSSHSLPKLVHFTVKDKNKLQPHQVLAMASWAYYNPGYSLMLFDDADIRAFMTTYYRHLLPTFDGLGSPVERTDLWRYLVLCRMGGVYADSDVMAARPISQWAQDAGLLVGIENVFTTPEEARERSYSRQVQMVQWSIAARPQHPVLCRMGDYVARHVAEERAGEFLDPNHDHAILERTGPGIWSDSVHDYLRQVGNTTVEQLVTGGRVGDVRILPQPVFGCPTATFHAADPLPYAYHMFMGSWKSVTQPGGLTTFIRKLSSSLHRQQQQLSTSSEAAGAVAAAAAAATAATGNHVRPAAAGDVRGGSMRVVKQPRRPILEEQIMQHRAQQQKQQQQQQQQQGVQLQQQKLSTLGAQDLSQPGQQQQVRAAGQLHTQHLPPQQQQQQQVLTHAPSQAASGTKPHTRRLRSTQALLVRSSAAHVTLEGVFGEPELPSKVLTGLPTLSLLVMVMLVVMLYKRQQGNLSSSSSNSSGGLLAYAQDCVRAARSIMGWQQPLQQQQCSSLSRPHSRTHLGLVAAAPPALPAQLLPPVPPSAALAAGLTAASSILSAGPEAVCNWSSQHAGRGAHRHKRSWGSSSSFSQL